LSWGFLGCFLQTGPTKTLFLNLDAQYECGDKKKGKKQKRIERRFFRKEPKLPHGKRGGFSIKCRVMQNADLLIWNYGNCQLQNASCAVN
jgi:hypothetical protein